MTKRDGNRRSPEETWKALEDQAAADVKERFIAWDEGKRLTFHVYAITLPLVSAFIEDFTLEPMGEGQTRFAWRAHYRPTLVARLVHPLVRGVFGALFESSIRRLTRYVTEHPTREAT